MYNFENHIDSKMVDFVLYSLLQMEFPQVYMLQKVHVFAKQDNL